MDPRPEPSTPGRRRKRGRHTPPSPAAAAAAAASAATPTPAAPPPPAAAAPRPPQPPDRPGQPGPTHQAEPLAPHLPRPVESRSEARSAEIRAMLTPYAPGERPRVVLVSVLVSAALALINLISWLAGVKIGGHHPPAGGIFIFAGVLLACAGGLWQMRAGAVLGFMSLLAIIAVLFTLYLVEASNVLGVVVALAIVLASGYLFFKLVRVLSRLQAPRPQESRSPTG